MLPMLLPGIRHVRTPLVTGTLYLLVIWMAFGPDRLLPLADPSSTTAERRLASAIELVGRSGLVAALAIVATLLGSLLVFRRWPIRKAGFDTSGWERPGAVEANWQFDNWVKERAWAMANTTYGQLSNPATFDEYFIERIRDAWVEDARIAGGSTEDPWADFASVQVREVEPAHLADALQGAVRNEFDLLRTRLQVEHESIFNEVDREQSEAELRYSIAPPIILLSGILVVHWHWLALALALVAVALLWQGYHAERRSLRLIASALRFGIVASPTMEAVEALSREGRSA